MSGESILLLQLKDHLRFHLGRTTIMVEGDADSRMIQLCLAVWQSTIDKLSRKTEQFESLQSKYNSLVLAKARLATEKSIVEKQYQITFKMLENQLAKREEHLHSKMNRILLGQDTNSNRMEAKETNSTNKCNSILNGIETIRSEIEDMGKSTAAVMRGEILRAKNAFSNQFTEVKNQLDELAEVKNKVNAAMMNVMKRDFETAFDNSV